MEPLAITRMAPDARPDISVIVHCYQHVKSIDACVQSILMQRLPAGVNVEVLLSDDGSSDGTVQKLEAFANARPDLFRVLTNADRKQYPPPCTPGRWNLIRAMEAAQGTFVAFIDSDDHWTDPDKLTLQWERMQQHPEASMCVHDGFDVYENGDRVEYVRPRAGSQELPDRFGTKDAVVSNSFPKGSMFYRRAMLPADTTELKNAPALDWTLLVLMSLKGPLEYIDRSMCLRHVSTAGVIAAKDILIKLDWYLRHLELNDRLTNGSFHTLIRDRMIATHQQALEIAQQRHDHEQVKHHLRWLVRNKAVPLRTAIRVFLVDRTPGLSRFYHRLRSRGRRG